MTLVLSDRIKESSISEGSGALTLGLPFGSFQSFSDGVGDGNTTYYCIENGVRWEVGRGTYTSAGNLLSRDEVLDSSASGAKINLEGASTVFCTLPADKAIFENENGHMYVAGISSLELNASGISSESINNSGQATFGEDVVVSGDLALLGQFLFDGDLANINRITTSGEIVSSGLLTLAKPNGNAGNFLHAYKDDGTEQTLALHVDNNTSPLWKFGLKTNPDNQTDPPTFAYVFARDGSVGLVSNTDNYCSISDDLGFTVQNVANNVLRVSSLTGVYIETSSSANPSLVITGPVLNTEDLTRWSQSDDTVLSVVDSGGRIGILTDTPEYELDVNGSGRMDTALFSGIYFQDGTFQSTAETSVSVSGWADVAITNGDNAVSGWADSTITNRDNAISGYFQNYVDGQDHSGAQVSGWAANTISAGDAAVSGFASTTISNGDAAVSGWADSTMSSRDAAISGLIKTNVVTNIVEVRAMITDSISSLSGSGAVYDGVTLASGDVVCVANPTSLTDVGIYSVNGGNWARHELYPSGAQVGSYVFKVTEGTAYSDTYWQTINNSGIVYSSEDVNYFQLSPQSNGILQATDEATVVFDAWKTHDWEVTLEGNRTLSVINEDKVNVIRVKLTQDGVGSRTVTWWSGISWVGGTIPTLTTTANKSDWFGFILTGSSTWDGFIIGQNI